MARFILFSILICAFFSCKEANKDLSVNEKDGLNILLSKANNFDYSKKDRIAFTKQAVVILKQRKDSTSLDYLFKIADRYYNADDNQNFYNISRSILKKSLENKDSLNICKALSNVGDYYYYGYKYDSAYYYYAKVEKIQKKLHLKEINERVTFNKASILLFERNFSQAEVEFVEMLKKVKASKNDRMIYECYLALGLALRGMNNNQGAIDYYQKALKQIDKIKNDNQVTLLKAQALNYTAIAYQKENNFSKAYFNTAQALGIDDFKKNNPEFFCYLINTHSYSKFMLDDESCLQDFYMALKVGDSLSNMHIQLNSKINLSEYYLKKNNFEEAKKYATDVLSIAHKNKIHEDELKALDLLAKVDAQKSTYYRERYITLSDSLQNVERTTRNKFARIEFETDEITTEKKLIEAEKERISAQRWLILGSGLFSVIALTLLYIVKSQRAKNKELRYLQEQQQANEEIYKLMLGQQQKLEEGKSLEKKRISRELHDGIMGKLTAIRLNLFVLQKRNDPETIAKCVTHVNEIQEIEKEIRKIAHDLNNNMFSNQSDFTAMVDSLVENIKEHSSIDFKIFTDESIDWLSVNNNVKMQVYRILQESLQNIEKYAQADKVAISMLQDENLGLIIKIVDNGIGFDTKIKGGIGLKNMKERALEINGTLAVKSEKAKGTQIILTIPY